jgi:hypothetical protein
MHIPRLVVIGHKEHGKGTFAALAREEFGLTVQGTSTHMSLLMFELMRETHGYATPEACYLDRNNHRELWFDEIRRYCGNNPARVIETILTDHLICEGPRHRVEFEAAKQKTGLWDLVIFIDASKRLPLEPASSMQLTRDDADIILENNEDTWAFKQRCRALLRLLFPNYPLKRR